MAVSLSTLAERRVGEASVATRSPSGERSCSRGGQELLFFAHAWRGACCWRRRHLAVGFLRFLWLTGVFRRRKPLFLVCVCCVGRMGV